MQVSALEQLKERAFAFLKEVYSELDMSEKLEQRLLDVEAEIDHTGTWFHTDQELTMGAKMAWRNSNRCIGRLYWKSLKVIDARHQNSPQDIRTALEHHIDYAFNGGDIRSVITVFRQKMPHETEGPRILNHQLLAFAGYENQLGVFTGDPREKDFTRFSMGLGWKGAETAFDVLPQVIRWPGEKDHWFEAEFPARILIDILHPEFDWFKDLGLKWYALPVISDMMLEIGGVHYSAAPFNGWYMGTEIGSRNFGDTQRYNVLPSIAIKMQLDTTLAHSLWKDRALVELNRAVLYSFEKCGITISNHHEASEQFLQFEASEIKNGRSVTADWSWINPPMSSSSTGVFHRTFDNTVKGPNFYYQDSPIEAERSANVRICPFHSNSLPGKV